MGLRSPHVSGLAAVCRLEVHAWLQGRSLPKRMLAHEGEHGSLRSPECGAS